MLFTLLDVAIPFIFTPLGTGLVIGGIVAVLIVVALILTNRAKKKKAKKEAK